MGYEKVPSEEEYFQSRADERVWRRARELGVSRRRFMQILTSAGVGVALSGRIVPVARAQTAPAPVVKPTPKDHNSALRNALVARTPRSGARRAHIWRGLPNICNAKG